MVDLNSLNKQQQEIARTTEGPLLVLAGAGSGKTRSVIYRTAYLIRNKGVKPWNILVVTFTNKAANELKERLEAFLKIKTNSLWIGTFHSICLRILRYEQEKLPFGTNFSIFDEADQKSLVKRIYKSLQIDDKKFPVNQVRSIISRQKNNLIRPGDFFSFNDRNFHSEMVQKIYRKYQDSLKKNNALDFDDLLMYTAFLLHDNNEIREKYARIFQYVMIDEYQDTNYAQFKIINLIAGKHQNLCVVGDDDQAIYGWRGADLHNILNFEKDYQNVKIIKLEQNYRSPETVLELANSLIEKNDDRHRKKLWTERKSHQIPEFLVFENENQEADFVARQISQKIDSGVNPDECVILYRTNAQSRVFEKAFAQNEIKYKIVGGVNFYQRKEIKDIIAYLRVILNHNDSESLLRIINFPPRGIGAKTIQKMQNIAAENDRTLFQVALDNSSFPNKKIDNFAGAMQNFIKSAKTVAVNILIQSLIKETNLLEYYQNSKDPKDIARVENIEEFMAATEEFAENFESETGEKPLLEDYLQNLSLQTDLDKVDENIASVKLMTMHNAKGLEFENVFIVGLEEGLIPHSLSADDPAKLEEERRLLYVAITRAKQNVIMTNARMRRKYNCIEYTYPSRFISDFDDKLYNKEDSEYYNINRPLRKQKQREKRKTEFQYYKIGQKIEHGKFGKGVILNIDGSERDAKLTISFSRGKLKKIMGNFVKIVK